MSTHPLRALLDDAAAGKFLPADGVIEVVPPPGGRADAIVALTGHFMLAADIDPTRSPRCSSSGAWCAIAGSSDSK